MWRLVLTITYCAVQAAKIAKVFARLCVLRPVGDHKLVHDLRGLVGDNCKNESAEECEAEASGQHDVASRKGGFEFGFGFVVHGLLGLVSDKVTTPLPICDHCSHFFLSICTRCGINSYFSPYLEPKGYKFAV